MKDKNKRKLASMKSLTDRLMDCTKEHPLMTEYLQAILQSFQCTEQSRQILKGALMSIAEGTAPPKPYTLNEAAAATLAIAQVIDDAGSEELEKVCLKNMSTH